MDKRTESIGTPVGYYCRDSRGMIFYQIGGYYPLKPTVATGDRFEVTASEHLRVSDAIDRQQREFPGLRLLGWVHSHPKHVPDATTVDNYTAGLFYQDPLLTIIMNPFTRSLAVFDLHTSGIGPNETGVEVGGTLCRLRNKKGIVVFGDDKRSLDFAGSFQYYRGEY